MKLSIGEIEERMRAVRSALEARSIYRTGEDYKMLDRDGNRTWTWTVAVPRAAWAPGILRACAEIIASQIRLGDWQVAGVESSGSQLAAAVALVADKNLLSVRRSKKTYGYDKMVSGTPNGFPCVVIDDYCSSGASIERAVRELNGEKIEAVEAWVVMSYARPTLSVPLKYVFLKSEIFPHK